MFYVTLQLVKIRKEVPILSEGWSYKFPEHVSAVICFKVVSKKRFLIHIGSVSEWRSTRYDVIPVLILL
jgi:hypothetical protein